MDNAVLTPLMLLHRLFAIKFLVADVTFKWAIISMSPLMDPKIALLSVLFSANFAGKWFFSRMSDQMPFHSGHANEAFATDSAYR